MFSTNTLRSVSTSLLCGCAILSWLIYVIVATPLYWFGDAARCIWPYLTCAPCRQRSHKNNAVAPKNSTDKRPGDVSINIDGPPRITPGPQPLSQMRPNETADGEAEIYNNAGGTST